MKEFSWIAKNGMTIKLVAECKSVLRNKVNNLDGYEIESSDKEVITTANLIAYADGKKIDSCWNTDFWKVIPVKDGVKRIHGINKIGFTEEIAVLVEKFLESVIENGKTEEVKAYEKEKATKERENEIKSLEEIVANCNKQGELPDKATAKVRMDEYNRIHNEGGSGYVPYIYSKEEYEHAKQRLEILMK